MICPACGSRNPRMARYCGTCGAALSDLRRGRFRYERQLLPRKRVSPVPPRPQTKTPSTIGLVLGLFSLTPATFVTGIPAIILSILALRLRMPGRGRAYTGLVTGAIGTVILTFVMLPPLVTWERELHRIGVVKQNMQAYRAALDDYAAKNEGHYPRSGISWEKEDEDGMVLHFKARNGLLTGIPFNPYTQERYRIGRDFFYWPESLAEAALGAAVSRTDPGCPYVGMAAPGGVPGTIVVLGWSPAEERGSPTEYAIVGYGRSTAEPLAVHRGQTFFVLHN